MYSGVPQKARDPGDSLSNCLERLKSTNKICPPESIRIFSGFKSLKKKKNQFQSLVLIIIIIGSI